MRKYTFTRSAIVQETYFVEAEAGAVANTGMETAYLTGTVSKYSGMNTLSVELLDGVTVTKTTPGSSSVVQSSLVNAIHHDTDLQSQSCMQCGHEASHECDHDENARRPGAKDT